MAKIRTFTIKNEADYKAARILAAYLGIPSMTALFSYLVKKERELGEYKNAENNLD